MSVIDDPKIYVGGEWRDPSSDASTVVRNPATEETLAVVPDASSADVSAALSAARTAFDEGPWPKMAPRERARLMLRMAEAMERRHDQIIDLLVREAGSTKPVAEAVQYALPLAHFVDMAERVVWSFEPVQGLPPAVGPTGLGQGVISREPAGVASLITAFNFPFYLNLMKIGPALGAGCTAVLKGSPMTPLITLLMGEVADEAGIPPGVLNIVTGGAAAGELMTTSPMVDVVSFTGSDTVGKVIAAQAAGTLKRVVLELGGKSASIVCADADLSQVIPNVVFHMTMQCGQGCSLLTRTVVHESIHDELVAGVAAALAKVRVGDPSDESVDVGPLISAAQRERVEGYIRSGIDQKGEIAFGGGRPAGLDRGYFVEPTLFARCTNDMTIAQDEIFGPVQTVIPFSDLDEAVRIANDSRYGLGGAVWSADTAVAYDVAKRLRAGFITVNGGSGDITPYGPYGGYKQSGLGREFGQFGFDEFIETKSIGWPAGR